MPGVQGEMLVPGEAASRVLEAPCLTDGHAAEESVTSLARGGFSLWCAVPASAVLAPPPCSRATWRWVVWIQGSHRPSWAACSRSPKAGTSLSPFPRSLHRLGLFIVRCRPGRSGSDISADGTWGPGL